MTQYETSLRAMIQLLERVNEKRWLNWMREDLEAWHDSRCVEHHRSAYGGRGTFNDVVLCQANHHNITKDLEPFANSLFDWLKALCSFFAMAPEKSFTSSDLLKSVGLHDPSILVTINKKSPPDSMRGLYNPSPLLYGHRCPTCGYSEASQSNIDIFILKVLLPPQVFSASEDGTLEPLVEQVMTKSLPGYKDMLDSAKEGLKISNITLSPENWPENCPSCDGRDSAVYRWENVGKNPLRFTPSEKNVQISPTVGHS